MVIIYARKGDYLFPNMNRELLKQFSVHEQVAKRIANVRFAFEDTEKYCIGKYGFLRRTYMKEHKSGWYQSMLLTGKLDRHLAEIDMQATDRISLLVDQMKKADNVTEELKARDQQIWTQRMMNIINRAEEIVLAELIYA